MTEPFDVEIGARIQSLRETKGLMQSELAGSMKARGLNWSQTILSKVERGERPLRLQEAAALVKELGLSNTEELLGDPALFSRRLAESSWAFEARKEDLEEAAFGYIRALSALSLLELCQSLKADPFAAWKVSCHFPRLWTPLRSAVHGGGMSFGEDVEVRELDGILEEMGIPSVTLAAVPVRINALVAAASHESVLASQWGRYSFMAESRLEASDENAELFLRSDARDVAYSEIFSLHFPNVVADEAVQFWPDSVAGAADSILRLGGRDYSLLAPLAAALGRKPVGGDE